MKATASTTPSPEAAFQPSIWHSPVPYLMGGLAATLGLIAFALLFLACSSFNLADDIIENATNEGLDLEAGDSKPDKYVMDANKNVFEEKYLVIMAGEATPTYLATPVLTESAFVNQKPLEMVEEKDKEGSVG
uniref:protein GLUTAMINE DUMPER 3-like n=1 Tax=Erigeron canadensis TaxID=72917 RepID=UPI001CB98F39|nr:protein GLUTAMINE DUMPER 3-like [Erigeron canadensis]